MSNWYKFIIAVTILIGALIIAIMRDANEAFVIALLIMIAHETKRHT